MFYQNYRENFEEYFQRQNQQNLPFQNIQSNLNGQNWQQQQNSLGATMGHGLNTIVGQIGSVASSIANNPSATLQKVGSQIGDQLESRWISLQTAPRKFRKK